jgi:hypothetical protein
MIERALNLGKRYKREDVNNIHDRFFTFIKVKLFAKEKRNSDRTVISI